MIAALPAVAPLHAPHPWSLLTPASGLCYSSSTYTYWLQEQLLINLGAIMNPDSSLLAARIERLERTVRRMRFLASAAAIGWLGTWLIGATRPPQVGENVLRARTFIVEDDQGRERIVLGAPMPDGRQYVGMKILNAEGAEQFGLGLKPDGSVGMGFDTRAGVGDARNRERLNMGVTATGQGWIRYLDNHTRARLRLVLDSSDAPVLQLLDWPDDQRILVRQLGFARDTILEWKR